MFKQKKQLYYHAMMLPGMIFLIIFNFVPLLGLFMAFENYSLSKGIIGSPWVGLQNFKFIFFL